MKLLLQLARTAPWKLLLRKSMGVPLAVATIVMTLLNSLLRETTWKHEWLWAIYDFHFVTIFLGPLAAGFAAWEAGRMSKTHTFIAMKEGGPYVALFALIALNIWISAAYLIAAAGIGMTVIFSGTPGLPGIDVLITFVPALTFLACWSAVGYAIGSRWDSKLVAPLSTIGAFAVVILAYTTLPGIFVQVGGASASLVGLTPRHSIQIGQILFFLSVASLSLSTCRPVVSSQMSAWLSGGAIVATTASIAFVLSLGGDVFRPQTPHLHCQGPSPSVCLADGYQGRSTQTIALLAPYVGAVRELDGTLPERFTQDPNDKSPRVALLPVDLVLGNKDAAAPTLMNTYIGHCDFLRSDNLREAYYGVSYWMYGQERVLPDDPRVPEIVKRGKSVDRDIWIRAAMQRLSNCAP